jgi:ATP-dependent Clp protease protease subunit
MLYYVGKAHYQTVDPPHVMEPPDASPHLPTSLAERLFEARTVIISGPIHQDLAATVTAQLIGLATVSDDPITVIINSQGGHVESGDTIHDVVRFITPPVRMIGTGWVASAGALIYVAAPTADRYCLPNTRFLLHQPSGGVRGPGSDIAIEAEQIVAMRERINRIFAQQTGQPPDRIRADTDRNFWLSADEAIDYGLAGHIVTSARDVPRS